MLDKQIGGTNNWENQPFLMVRPQVLFAGSTTDTLSCLVVTATYVILYPSFSKPRVSIPTFSPLPLTQRKRERRGMASITSGIVKGER